MKQGNNGEVNAANEAKKAARKAKMRAFLASPWFWVVIGVVVLLLISVIAVIWWRKSGRTPIPDNPKPDDPEIQSKNEISVDNSRPEEEILEDIFKVSSHFESAVNRILPNYDKSNEAKKMFALKIARELAADGALQKVVLDAYSRDLMDWDANVQAVNLKIIEAIAANSEIEGDITTCTQVTNFKTKEDKSDTTVTTVDTKKAWYVIVPVEKTSTTQSRTKTHNVEWTPTCTKWQVDPAKLAAQMAMKQQVYALLYGNLQRLLDSCPQVDEYISYAKG